MCSFDTGNGFTCFWKIENFDLCKVKVFESMKFKIDTLKNSNWHLKIEKNTSKYDSLELFIYKDEPFENSTVKTCIFLLEDIGWVCKLDAYQFKFKGGDAGLKLLNLLSSKGVPYEKHKYLINGSLTVAVHLSNGRTKGKSAQCFLVSKMIEEHEILHSLVQGFQNLNLNDLKDFPAVQISRQIVANNIKQYKSKCSQTDPIGDDNIFQDQEDIIRLFRAKKFQYVTLRTPTKDFSVHKALLCSRSPVFNAMFDEPMSESSTNIVQIEDIDSETLSHMLQFLYLEPLPDIKWDDAVKLYYAADKYQINLLKNNCIMLLGKEISEQNVCEAFILADMHQDGKLMHVAQFYFDSHSKVIRRSEQWKNLLLQQTELATDILIKFSNKL